MPWTTWSNYRNILRQKCVCSSTASCGRITSCISSESCWFHQIVFIKIISEFSGEFVTEDRNFFCWPFQRNFSNLYGKQQSCSTPKNDYHIKKLCFIIFKEFVAKQALFFFVKISIEKFLDALKVSYRVKNKTFFKFILL